MNFKKVFIASAVALSALTANAQAYFERLAMEGVEILGAITYGKVDQYTTMTQGFYSFPFDSKFAPVKTQPEYTAYVAGGCCYHDGIIYSNEFDDSGSVHKQKPVWRRYDAKTWELLDEHTLTDNCTATTNALAYDATTDKIFGINYTYDESYIVSIDPATGEMTRLGQLDIYYRWRAIGCNNAGTLYIIYMNPETDVWSLGKVRKSDGKVAKVRDITVTNLLEGDSYINSGLKQAMFYNTATDKFYWMYDGSSMYLYDEYTAIMEVDPVTATATQVAYTEDNFLISGAFFVEPRLKAPGIIENFAFTTDAEGETIGKMSFNAPTTAYDGSALSGTLKIVVSEYGDVLLETTAQPGELVESSELDLANDNHTVSITVSNEVGDGPTVKRTFYAGYDIPVACGNITLTNEGLTTYLTWDAPTTGQNGMPINKKNLTYKVVRYPYEVTVAENQKECSFTETHPEDMTRYVYMVTPYDGTRKGPSKYSNNLIVGTPLDVPYGGPFTGPADMLNYYTIRDGNGDLYQWKYDSSTNRALYEFNASDTSVGADDWLIAPAVNYKAGHTYVLTFTTYSSMPDYPEAMEVTLGNKPTISGQSKLLLDLPSIPGYNEDNDCGNEYTTEFTVPTDGTYHYAFHAISEPFHANLYLYNISVKDKDTDGIVSVWGGNTGLSVSNHTLTITGTEGQTVSIYDASGRQVCQTSEANAAIQLPSGIYMVNAGGQTHKIVVK